MVTALNDPSLSDSTESEESGLSFRVCFAALRESLVLASDLTGEGDTTLGMELREEDSESSKEREY